MPATFTFTFLFIITFSEILNNLNFLLRQPHQLLYQLRHLSIIFIYFFFKLLFWLFTV